MADDIAACPHSLAERETAVADGMCPICSADALSRLTIPPLPKEIAKLIEELSCTEGPGGPFVLPVICQEAAAALRALALERDAIRAKTFKECAEAIEAKHCDLTSTTAGWIIRALAQTDEGKT